MTRLRLIAAVCVCMALSAPARAEPVTGAGSTFVFPLLSAWAEKFRNAEADGGDFPAPEGGLDYEPVGSLGGIMRVIAKAVDFGATEAPLGADEVVRHGLAQFPIAAGGIAVVVNVPGVADGTLRLSRAALADIYLGKIDRWTHPALKGLNPDLPLPDEPVMVVHRADGSGSTYNFAAYLASASMEWRDRVGVDTELRWPAGTGARGSGGVIETVKANPNSIGYVEFGQAARIGLTVARVENRAGQFVAPSRHTIASALEGADWAGKPHFDLLTTDMAGADAYPITATVYALMPQAPPSGDRGRRALRLFDGALTRWQQDALDLGYVPLPDRAVEQVRTYWKSYWQP